MSDESNVVDIFSKVDSVFCEVCKKTIRFKTGRECGLDKTGIIYAVVKGVFPCTDAVHRLAGRVILRNERNGGKDEE